MSRTKPPRTGGRRVTPTQPPPPAPPTQGPPLQQQQPVPHPQQNPPPPQDDDEENTLDTQQSGEHNADFDAFRKMSDDDKADLIKEALKEEPPSFLPDNPSQRLLAYLGGDNHPTIVPDAQLDAMRGIDIYRQVAGIHDSKFGTNLTSQQIAAQVMTGDLTQYAVSWGGGNSGAGGGTAYGRAIYFGASYSEIKNCYGTGRNIRGKQDSTMFRCKIDPKAKGMTYSALRNAVAREIGSGSKLGRVLRGINDSDDRETIYALSKGIDYTHDGSYDYHMVYNRGCLVASSKMKHNTSDTRW